MLIEHAAMAQEAEHVLGKDEVTSSNLVSSSKITFFSNFCWKEGYFFMLWKLAL